MRTVSHSAMFTPDSSGSSKSARLGSPPMSRILSKQRVSGFTMTELAVTMGIVAMLTAIAMPSFKYVTTSNRVAGEVNTLLGDMRYARTEAIKEGQPVTVCASSNGTSCTTGNPPWENGWIVFSDANGNHIVDGTDAVLRVQRALSVEFGNTDTFRDPALPYLVFNREGFAPTGLAGTTYITLHDSSANLAWTRCVAVTVVGMVSTVSNKADPACT